MTRRTVRADLLLLLAAAIWGFAFVAQKAGMDHVGPFVFNGVRFGLGTLSLMPLWLARRRGVESTRMAAPSPRTVLGAGVAVGLVLFVSASLQQIGIVHTTAGKAGFITSLYVVLVPALASLSGHRVGTFAWVGVVVATAGLYLLSVNESLRISPGDALVLAGAFGWAVHVLLIAHWSRKLDVVELALLQFATCSVLSLAVAIPLESFALDAILDAGVPILYGGLASVGIAYTLQLIAQRDAQPTAAAILLSLESVFAALGGWIIRGESMPSRAMLGCCLMFAAVVVSQIGSRSEPEDGRVEGRAA